jgi:hypothetical protein
MNRKAIQTIKPTLEEVQDRFRIWRKTRKKRTSIPRDLWKAAIEQTQSYSINIVSKALGLSYTDLKRRVKASRANVYSNPSEVAAFVELDLKDTMPGRCVIEMDTPRGDRLKMDFMGTVGIDLLKLAKAFWDTNS